MYRPTFVRHISILGLFNLYIAHFTLLLIVMPIDCASYVQPNKNALDLLNRWRSIGQLTEKSKL